MGLTTTTLYLCICIALAAVVYDQLTKRIPSRLRAEEAPRSAFGFVRADKFSPHDKPARAHGIDIIFVHGLGSNPDTTWGPKERNWINNFLPQDIPITLRKDVRLFFFNYDSYWKRDAVQTRLWRLGESVVVGMCSQIRWTAEEKTRSLIFVGHSYGGLVIKRALTLASQNRGYAHIAEHVRGILFLGTPHRGSEFSTWGSIAARALQPLGSNVSLLQEVEYDALSLLELHKDFERVCSEKLRVVNFYEQRSTRLLKVWFFRWEELCVLEQSATYGQGENVGLNVDHYGLNKFQSKDEDAYKSIVWMLLSLVKHIAAEKQRQLYSVPASTVETYTERHKLSLAITERLRMRHDKASVPHALAISGPSGTGKTQLALKYVEDHEHEYNPIFWIDAKDAESVLSSFERCASELQLRVSHRREHSTSLIDSSTVQAVLRWLENRKETDDAWLMVIDNADEFFWRIKKVLARGDRGSIIITSQDSQARRLVDGGCESVRVGMMERLEARTLILHHLQLDEELATGDIADDCDKVAEQLGHLALALDLAGAYISNQDTNPGEALRQYLQRYIHHKDSLLRSESFRKLLPSDQTVWTVWDTTIEKINALQRLEDSSLELPARSLLPLLARFRGAVVQDELFRLASPEMSKTCNELGVEVVELPSWLRNALAVNRKDWDDFCYERTRDRLVRYRLLQRTEGKWPGVWMHGLVRWRASKCEEEQPWEKWHLMTVLAACAKMPQMVNRFHDQGEFIAHVPRLEEAYLEGLDIGEEKKLFAWRTASLVYNNEGRWTESEELQMWIVESSKNIFGEEHPNTLKSMKVLASAYMNQGRWKQAGELHVKRLETWSRVLGDAHPSTLKCIDDLRRSYRWYGREKEALELLVRVKEMRAILA